MRRAPPGAFWSPEAPPPPWPLPPPSPPEERNATTATATAASTAIAICPRFMAGTVSWRPVPDSTISLTRGAPSLDIVAVDELRAAAERAFTGDPKGAFMYGTSKGYGPLLDWLAAKHDVSPDQVVATNGSRQADMFLFGSLVGKGDQLVIEAPTCDRTLLALQKLGAELIPIGLEDDGID